MLPLELLQRKQDHGDQVGDVQREGGERSDSVESRGRGDVDQAQQPDDDRHEHDCSDGDVVDGGHVGEELGEGEAVVPGEGPGEAGGGGQHGEDGADDDDDDAGHHCGGGGGGLGRLVEDLDDRVARGGGDCVGDVADRVEHCDDPP